MAYNISTHTPLAGRDLVKFKNKSELCISTHTPLAGRDRIVTERKLKSVISTHTPLAGRDDGKCAELENILGNFYSHAPRGT